MNLQGLSCSKPAEDKNGETTFPIISQGFGNIDHCAPDTLGNIQGIAYPMFQYSVDPHVIGVTYSLNLPFLFPIFWSLTVILCRLYFCLCFYSSQGSS